MIRRTIVILVLLVAFGIVIWAGVSNYHVRQMKRVAAMTPPGQQLVLTKDGAATPSTDGAPDTSGAGPQGPPNPLLGKQAPPFSLVDTDGKKVSLASYRGRPVLINFWATWCGPCKYEIPWLTALRTKYAGQGFEILGISSDELDATQQAKAAQEKAAIMKAAAQLHINYPVLLGGDTITEQYGGIDLLPQSFYVDKTGKIVAVITGAGSKNEAEADIQKAIGSGA